MNQLMFLLLGKVLCTVGFHHMHVQQRFGKYDARVECCRCHEDLAMNSVMRLSTAWRDEAVEIFEECGFKVDPGRMTLEC